MSVGEKRTVTVQLLPAASEVPQVVDTKLKAAPVTELEVGVVNDSGPAPVLVTVEVRLVEVPTLRDPKDTAETLPDWLTPVPDTASDAPDTGAVAEAVTEPE